MDESIDADLEWLIDDEAEVPEEKVVDKQDETTDSSQAESLESIKTSVTYSDTDDDYDDEDDGLTPAEREILQRNTLLNDASDRDDYDLKNKVERANADLEKTGLDSAREKKVMFKKKLVDVKAPPIDFSEGSSSSSDSENEEESATSKASDSDGKEREKSDGEDKDILVEKDGKFQLMNETAHHDTSSSSSNSDEETKSHPKVILPKESSEPNTSTSRPRPNSAPVLRTRPESASRSSEYSHIRSPYALSPEMKELMQKRADARAAREEEERAQERAKEEENKQNAEYAWKCWVEKKDQEMRERKKVEDEKKQNEKHDSKEEAREAYQLWLSEKRKQGKKHRFHEQQRQLEVEEGWYRRDRKECDTAYKQWLGQKDKEARAQRKYERTSGQQTRADAYRMRRLKRLLTSIQNSHKYSY